MDYQQFIVTRDGKPPIRFMGHVLASYESTSDRNNNYSGSVGISRRYQLFLTKGGKYVFSIAVYSQWRGSRDTYQAWVLSDIKEVYRHSPYNDRYGDEDELPEDMQEFLTLIPTELVAVDIE